MIKRFIHRLFGLHNWVTFDKCELIHYRDGKQTAEGTRYTLKCAECGAIKKKDII